MESIGNKIRIQRQIKGYSQEYMAFMLDISQAAYSKLERDETELSLKRVYEIAEILEISPFTLMPPPKFGIGINYLKMRQSFYRMQRYLSGKLHSRKMEAEKLHILHSDKSNSQTD